MAACYVKFYYDWIEQTAALSDAERGRLFISILEYARSGIVPEISGRECILFPVFKSQLDRDDKKAEIVAANGRTGGRPKTNRNQTKPNETKDNQTPHNKDKDKDKDNNQEKENKEKDPFSVFAGDDALLLSALNDFESMRTKIKKPLTDSAKKMLISKLEREFSDRDERIAALNEAVLHCWQSVYQHKKTAVTDFGGEEPPI